MFSCCSCLNVNINKNDFGSTITKISPSLVMVLSQLSIDHWYNAPMALEFNFYTQFISVLSPQVEVEIQDLLNEIRQQEYTYIGLAYPKIADAAKSWPAAFPALQKRG